MAIVNPAKLKRVNFFKEMHGQDPIDPEKDWQKAILDAFDEGKPSGSEGPVMMNLHCWPRVDIMDDDYDPAYNLGGSSLYRGDLKIVGDLRDRDEEYFGDILTWLNGIKLPEGTIIRQGIVLCECNEWRFIFAHNYNDDIVGEWRLLAGNDI